MIQTLPSAALFEHGYHGTGVAEGIQASNRQESHEIVFGDVGQLAHLESPKGDGIHEANQQL